MQTKNDPQDDPSRLAIAVFIVATTLTLSATHFSIPSFLSIPLGMFFLGLIVSAILAFLFILAKGYALRYGKKRHNLIDNCTHILYNLAVTAYAIVMGAILFGFIYKYLDEASKGGNAWASIGLVIMFVGIVAIINGRDIKDISITAWKALGDRLRKSK